MFLFLLFQIDLDLVFEDIQKQSSSIDNNSRIKEETHSISSSNSISSNSPSVPYVNSKREQSSYYENIKHSLSRLKAGIFELLSSNRIAAHPLSVSNETDKPNLPNQSGGDEHLLHR